MLYMGIIGIINRFRVVFICLYSVNIRLKSLIDFGNKAIKIMFEILCIDDNRYNCYIVLYDGDISKVIVGASYREEV